MSNPDLHGNLEEIQRAMLSRLQDTYPEEIKSLRAINSTFRARGFSIFLVGGAVRNLALGTELKDFDLASDALPENVMSMFKHVIPTGIQHGTVTLVYHSRHYEITTFRLDGDYSDARRPDSVSFTPDIDEDLKRRDFTINAMALSLETWALRDPHDGLRDLGMGLIRTVGSPLERFSEDGLRIVRGIRFASQLGFSLDPETLSAMPHCLDKLRQVSIERFRDELLKILASPQASRGLYLLRGTGVLALFLESLALLSARDFARSALAIDLLADNPTELRLAALFSSSGPDATAQMCTSLRLPNAVIKRCTHLVRVLGFTPRGTESDKELRHIASRIGADFCTDALMLISAVHTSQAWIGEGSDSPQKNGDWATAIAEIQEAIPATIRVFRGNMERVLAANPPLSIRDLAINGAQLIDAGIQPGPSMGKLLEYLLEKVLEDPGLNELESLRRAAISSQG